MCSTYKRGVAKQEKKAAFGVLSERDIWIRGGEIYRYNVRTEWLICCVILLLKLLSFFSVFVIFIWFVVIMAMYYLMLLEKLVLLFEIE